MATLQGLPTNHPMVCKVLLVDKEIYIVKPVATRTINGFLVLSPLAIKKSK